MNRQEQMVTVQELANYLQVSYDDALEVMKTCIPYIYVAGHYRMQLKHIKEYL